MLPPCFALESPSRIHQYPDAPSGRPRAYFLLPASELTAASGWPYSYPMRLYGGGGRVWLNAREANDALTGTDVFRLYEFSSALEPEYVRLSSSCRIAHQKLEEQGRLRHRFSACPELVQPVKIRRWEAVSGWREIAVPWAPGQIPPSEAELRR